MYKTTIADKEYVVLSRNPFAREDTVRATAGQSNCDWCGKVGHMWHYGTWSDSGTVHMGYETFCSVQCARDFGMIA